MRPAPLLGVVGPTCTGKTALAVQVALRLGNAELVNADSRQVRTGLQVGTCAPTAAQLQGIRCHLVQQVPIGADYTVADWLGPARQIVSGLRAAGRIPIVVGGTGLYIRALLDGYRLAPPPEPERRALRNRLAEGEDGLQQLVAELVRRAPDRIPAIDLQNPRRVIRALEAVDAGGDSPGATPLPGQVLRIGLDTDRTVHAGWVRHRTELMFTGGALPDEVERVLSAGVDRQALQRCGIGYREALAVAGGTLETEEAIELVVRRTLRYARAQRTFFRGDPAAVRWLDAASPPGSLVDAAAALLEAPAMADSHLAGA